MKCVLIFISLALVSYSLAQPVTPNQCSSLGSNAPLEERDCQIFILKTGFCCYLTVTTEIPNPSTDPNADPVITIRNNSCIFAPSKDPNERQNIVNSLEHLGTEILIECSSKSFNLSLAVIIMIFIMLIN